jgi:hypothetical protein
MPRTSHALLVCVHVWNRAVRRFLAHFPPALKTVSSISGNALGETSMALYFRPRAELFEKIGD